MKYIFNFFLLIGIFIISLSCSDKSPKLIPYDNSIVKIIKTSAYEAENEFDEIVPGEPVYDLGYDRTMGLDFSWRIEHFDKYNNIIYKERFHLNDYGEEEVYGKVINEYYSLGEGKLSKRIIDEYGITEIKYIRDEEGRVLEIQTINNDKLFEKTIYAYNESGQRIREEKFKKDGLDKIGEFYYNSEDKEGKIIKEIHSWQKEISKYTIEWNYEWYEDGLLYKSRKRCYEFGKVITDLFSQYENYHGAIASKESTTGFETPDAILSGKSQEDAKYDVDYSIERIYNNNGDLVRYIKSSEYCDDYITGEQSYPYTIQDYRCEYIYNKKYNWIKAILFPLPISTDSFIIIREIVYLY